MTTFSEAEASLIHTAAYGAVLLQSLARPGPISSTKQNVAGALSLTAVPGPIGRILGEKRSVDLAGSYPEVADRVLPALRAAVALLEASAPDQTATFRAGVLDATADAMAATGTPNQAQRRTFQQIEAALGDH